MLSRAEQSKHCQEMITSKHLVTRYLIFLNEPKKGLFRKINYHTVNKLRVIISQKIVSQGKIR